MKDTVRFRTAGGALVVWIQSKSRSAGWGSYTCQGCGHEGTAQMEWADQHATGCRALPD